MNLGTLGTPSEVENRTVTYKKHRKFKVVIDGIDVSGGDVDEAFISFTSDPTRSKWVVLGEIPAYSWEVQRINNGISAAGGTVTAIHNHWFIDDVYQIMYLHFQLSTSQPSRVAQKLKVFWDTL